MPSPAIGAENSGDFHAVIIMFLEIREWEESNDIKIITIR